MYPCKLVPQNLQQFWCGVYLIMYMCVCVCVFPVWNSAPVKPLFPEAAASFSIKLHSILSKRLCSFFSPSLSLSALNVPSPSLPPSIPPLLPLPCMLTKPQDAEGFNQNSTMHTALCGDDCFHFLSILLLLICLVTLPAI